MKNFTNNFKQFTSRLSARWLIMALMMLVGTSSVWAVQKNINWQGKVYFLVPEKWDLSTYSTVQVDITRTTSATTSNHQEYIGNMTRIGSSRLFYKQINADHSNWNQNEYIAFTANSYAYNSGSFNLNGNKLYSTPLDYGCNNSNNYYLFKPSTESQFTTTTNGNTLTASYNSSRDNVLKVNQAVEIYTNGSLSTSGGSVSLTGYYLSSDDAMTQSTVNSSSTSAKYEAAPGSEMKLTASAKSGYEFDGWYNAASGGTLLSSNTSYTYNVYGTKTIYARFKQSCVNVEVPNITSDSPICLGSELTLTLKDRQDGVTYNIGNQEIFTGGNNTYSFTPQTTGSASLTVVASHGEACDDETNQIVIDYTVNALPNAPILTTGSTNVCPGTLTLANFKAMAEQNTVVWYSNEECTQVVTTPTVEKGGTYTFHAKSKNASGCFSEGYSTLEVKVYDEPADFTLTAIPAEICSGADVVISISNKQDGVTYKLGNETIAESIKVNPTEDTEYYTVTAYLNACPDLTKSISTDIKVNPIPGFTVDPTNLSLCKGSTSETDLTVLSHVEVANGDPVWYDAETAGNVVTEGADLIKGGTYWVAAENAETGCINPERKAFTITIHDLPKYPDLKKRSAAVCQEANATVSLNELAEITDVIWYQGENEVQGPDAISIAEAGTFTYTAKAVNSNGCQSATGVDFILTVNLLPNVSIAGNTSAVFYEDVQLTATATDGATVKWYEDDVEKGEGLTYVVTSETATSKIVTAKAFLNGCESAVASHTVAFSAETCAPSNQIQIICTSTKSTTTYCYAFYGSNKTEIFGSWPGTKGTASGNVYNWTIENKDNVTIIFNAGKNTNQTDDLTGHEKGKKYFYTFDSSKSKDNTPENYTLTDTEDILSISAPAAKTISVSTTEGEGNIIFSGQVVKTGCDATNEYGFQYSSDEQTWTTVKVGENAAAGTAISNNTVKGLDGTYYVRAYITNDNSTQYGAVTEITVSTTKTPISNVTLNYCDENGGNVGVDPNPMCKGAIAYVKLSYVGSKYSDIKWLVEGVETNLVTDKGNDVWSYIIQGTGHLSVELRNDANKDNEDNPTWATSDKLSFTMKEEPVAPYISINPASGVICQGSSATIKVENPSIACSYKLVEGDTETGFTKYESGDLKYTVQNVGKYYVVAQHYECTDNEYTSNQVAINQIISTSAKISIEPKNQETTPWEPVNITVTADEGYVYEVTYTGNNNLQDVEGVIIKQKGDTYTYYIPRPTGWGEGNAVSVRTPVAYGIKAQLKVDGEANQCDLSFDTATITVKDEENEVCD